MISASRAACRAFMARPLRMACSAAVFAAIVVPGVSLAQEPDPVVARVNGTEIRSSDVAVAEDELGSSLPQMAPEARREYVITLLSDTLLVAHAAEAQGLADSAEFKRRLAFNRNRLLSEALLQQDARAAVTDAAMRQVYEEATKQMTAEKEVRARHILFRVENGKDEAASTAAEQKAKAAIARVKTGEDFAKLATELTEDPSGKENGGDLGYFSQDQMVPEFAEAAFKLGVGTISDPVRTQFGWHVIKVEDKRERPAPEFSQVKDQIENYLIRRSQTELVAKLRAAAKIERVQTPAAPEQKP